MARRSRESRSAWGTRVFRAHRIDAAKVFDIAPLAPLRQRPNLSCAPAGFDKGVERYDLRALSAMKAITPGAADV